jgi:SEC-C motif-containing protein
MTPSPAGLPKPQHGQPCPCGSGNLFENCCGPILARQRPAATAEQLMRSRFTAHVAEDFLHLHRTHLPTAKLPYVAEAESGPAMHWTRLVIHSHEIAKDPDLAFVDFSAFFAEDRAERELREKAEFRRIDGEWLYTRAVRSGPAPFKTAAPKVGRNDPCPCGSGKKYKQCCLLRA